MKITLLFYSAWAIGSGKGGQSKDSIILVDDDGLPLIPGRTLKGLLRDAFLDCGYSNDDAITLFGQEKKDTITTEELQEGSLRVNSAYLPNEFTKLTKEEKAKLFYAKMATRLDDDKQAVNHSLRKNEIAIPLTLESIILNKEDNTELKTDEFEKIENAFKMLKILGEKRHRGLGRVKATAKEFVPNTTNNTDENKNKITINKNARFRCTITEPLILMRKSKTDQNVASLDYIPGSTFRGVVAGAISNGNEFNNIIFNNTVQFGDAHLVINEKRSLKTPFSFYYDKNKDDSTLYNFHNLVDVDWVTKKPKSYKNGYLQEGTIQKVAYANRIKSSRSRKDRSSEEGGMFVYHYLKKGQEFEFEVRSEEPKYLKQIVEILNGKTKYFGKSKTAEFGGAIKIEYLGEKEKETPTTQGKYLYAESNLCFLNEYGEFTAHPTEQDLGAPIDAKINWEKSQVKFRTYAPYNQYRKNWDAERLIIEKGSVFVFEKEVTSHEEVTFDTEKLQNGLGCFLTEGYGKVLVSPSFLKDKEVNITPKNNTEESKEEKIPVEVVIPDDDTDTIKFIKTKYNDNVTEFKIENKVRDYLKENYSQKKSSQWARIFNATTRAKDFEELKCILKNECNPVKERDQSIFTGGSKHWEKKDISTIDAFLKEVTGNEIFALRKLSKKMIAKTKDRNN